MIGGDVRSPGYSCAVMDAEEKLRKLSGYVLNPDSIPVFFDI